MIRRLIWFWKADRLGPDMLSTHWMLHFKSTMRWICRKKFAHFGEGSEMRPHAWVVHPSRVSIGDNVRLHPGCMLFAQDSDQGRIVIEDQVGIGSGVQIYVSNHRHDRADVPVKLQGHYPPEPVVIRSGAWIGAGAILLPGVEIGNNAVVGAGAVVMRDVPARSVAMGNPARIVLRRD